MSTSTQYLRQDFRIMVEAWLSALDKAGITPLITCTVRSDAQQDALYAKGRTVPGPNVDAYHPLGHIVTNARAGQSAHQYGLALDFVPLDCGKPDWSGNGPVWDEAIRLAEANGMESLRPFESAHIQHPKWKQLAGIL